MKGWRSCSGRTRRLMEDTAPDRQTADKPDWAVVGMACRPSSASSLAELPCNTRQGASLPDPHDRIPLNGAAHGQAIISWITRAPSTPVTRSLSPLRSKNNNS